MPLLAAAVVVVVPLLAAAVVVPVLLLAVVPLLLPRPLHVDQRWPCHAISALRTRSVSAATSARSSARRRTALRYSISTCRATLWPMAVSLLPFGTPYRRM